MKTRIFFIRHGEIDNPNKIIYGKLPYFRLTQKGRGQIIETAKQLSKNKITAIYASPLLRTRQSAKIINETLHLPIRYSNYLLEVDTPMVGKTMDYVRANTINYNVFASKTSKDGETIQDVAKRMQKFINKIKKAYQGKNIAAVTHGDPIMIVRAIMTRLPLTINSLRPINRKEYVQHGEIYTAEFNS